MKQKRLPHLRMGDMKDMRRAVAALVAADETLSRSGWASAPAVRTLVREAIMVLGPLHDRAEPVYLEILSEQGPQTLRERAAAALTTEGLLPDPETDRDEPQED
jgi:hypothetical protein